MRAERDIWPSPAGPPTRVWRVALGGLALLAAVYALAQGLVRLPAFERWARERVAAELRARVGEVAVGPEVAVDALFRARFGPITLPGASAREPLVRVERLTLRPSLTGLLRGRVEPASVRLRGVRVAAGPRGRALRALLVRRERPAPAAGAPASKVPRARAAGTRQVPSVELRDLVVIVPLGAAGSWELGPIDAELEGARDAAGTALLLALRLPGGGAGELAARSEGERWRGRLRLDHLGPELLPLAVREGPAAVAGGEVSLELEGEASGDLSTVEGRLRVSAERVFLSGERVAEAPLGPLRLDAEGTLTWDGTERRVAFREGVLALGAALRVGATAEARLGSGVPFTAALRADRVDWTALVAALPPALAPPPGAPVPRGDLDARLELSGPLLAPAAWRLGASLELGRMREASRRGEPSALRRPFRHEPVTGVGERGRAFEIGPRTATFVPVAELPEHVVRAVTASEDAGFFAHPGFDFAELQDAFARGAEEGRVVRGGSTITQQLAKNLYLSREKTLARKVREAAITIALEAAVPKARLLEIYLNLVEWGPGVFGIGAAAQHWFGKDARELTAKEAAFLASIIPNPVRYHGMRARGSPSDAWEQRVDDLLLKMTEQGVLTEEDLLRARSEAIVFRAG